MGVCRPFLRCLSDPVGRSSQVMKLAVVTLHFLFAGILFLGKAEPVPWWYMVSYCFLFFATLVQLCSISSLPPLHLGYHPILPHPNSLFFSAIHIANPTLFFFLFFLFLLAFRYVVDAMRDACAPTTSIQSPSSVFLTVDRGHPVSGGNFPTSWAKLVSDLYPPGTSHRNLTCADCHVEQPPRSKHCHDCDRCVLQFDHHCLWIGTCIGQNNHCKFWWYVCGETALCIWTFILYIDYLDNNNISKSWLKNAIIILLLVILGIFLIFVLVLLLFHSFLIMTNQTTFELVRRRRIPYLRNIPERVHPFSRGMCRNIYKVCCGSDNLEPLPTAYEVEQKSRPYTCLDLFKCRCC
ncbi:Palmitoyltransferase DHHC domain [Arabidopsis suecica]|uniref:S-acyltransferase n=1 Tax=Arabidopsis suecica TaxID=45249 RepID=A0A8T1XY72_ARASU|nr:Palmitoyltransferase DHHC domain [Arabidopsis suecica]